MAKRTHRAKAKSIEQTIERPGEWRTDHWVTRILRRTTASSELGGISMAGQIRGSPGVGVGTSNRPMRVFGQFAVVYVVGGGGAYRDANGHRQSITPGDLIWVFPKLGHTYGPTDKPENAGWNEVYLCFHGPVFNLWARSGLIDERRPVWRLEPVEYWLNRFRWVLAGGLREAGGARPLVEVCRLQQVLAEARLFNDGAGQGRPARRLELSQVRGTIAGLLGAGEEVTGVQNEAADEAAWVEKACRLIERDLASGGAAPDESAAKAAGAMGMSYEGFRKRFARLLGTSPGRYLAARVMDRACEMMQEAKLTDKQIAMTLGFCDEFHFSRRFKAIVGCPPREFRRKVT